MAEIVPFCRPRSFQKHRALLEKVVDGEVVQCVNVDVLSPGERADFFENGKLAETRPANLPRRPLGR
ncbi:hypothetical protein HJC06_10565 [Rhizobium sp. NLR9b]|uniref:hypothetical protein n=1 Tax=unclassified Rhizobium TaxID=2613769 RepID=UPI001C837FA0|nr:MULTISPECIES: hypothetical protein [unclassified Rhizobium]MBX5226867.1 hypothetical protein [Rhizobium sp. NLR9b]MBX5287538.1 hypothetical protein [Rhizobium sp. NLR10b]